MDSAKQFRLLQQQINQMDHVGHELHNPVVHGTRYTCNSVMLILGCNLAIQQHITSTYFTNIARELHSREQRRYEQLLTSGHSVL